jgi:hypothetical protein
MNLVWHIIRKDVRRVAWVLLVWALTGAYLIAYKNMEIIQRSVWDNLGIVSLITHGALCLALIAAIVQEDGLNGVNEFWRTRPIAPGRILTAKLILVLTFFMVVPSLIVASQRILFAGRSVGFGWGDLLVPLALGVGVLACAAVAACTKDLGQYFLGGLACLMLGYSLGFWFASLAPAELLQGQPALEVTKTRVIIIFALTGVVSAGVLSNQYFTRRTALSTGAIAGTIVVLALVAAFWRWPLFG